MSLLDQVRFFPSKDSGPIDFAYEIHTKVGEKRRVPGQWPYGSTDNSSRQGIQVEIILPQLLWSES